MRIAVGKIMEVIYEDRAGRISKRRVRIIRIHHDRLVVYCFTRKALRTLTKSHILAMQPMFRRTG